jgi:hypothetical protein
MTTAICTRTEIDPRGPRFGGTITTIVLAIALVTVGTPLSDVLVVWQAIVFGLGAIVGLHAQPYGILYRKVVGPRLSPPQVLEDAAPPRFAQAVGLIFMLVALVSIVLGATLIAAIAIGFALAAAFLNAAFNFCLGCEMYLLGARLRHR